MSNDHKEYLESLSDIRAMMDKSSRFISLSGLSGVFAGIWSLIGAIFAYLLIFTTTFNHLDDYRKLFFLFTIAFGVIFMSLLTGIYFTNRNAEKRSQNIWTKSSQLLIINMSIPLVTGGVFSMIMVYHQLYVLIAPAMLLFYGMALLNSSKYTLEEIRYLGITEIILGIFSSIYLGYGIYFWAIGFGVAHIVYGLVMYAKYEKEDNSVKTNQ